MDAHPLGTATSAGGRLVLDDRVASGRISIEDGVIVVVALDEEVPTPAIRTSHRGSSTSTSTAGAATTRWATWPPSTGWRECSSGAA